MKQIEIRIKGIIGKSWSKWFEDLSISPIGRDETVLSGIVQDEAEIYGLISKLRDLGLQLISLVTEEIVRISKD